MLQMLAAERHTGVPEPELDDDDEDSGKVQEAVQGVLSQAAFYILSVLHLELEGTTMKTLSKKNDSNMLN